MDASANAGPPTPDGTEPADAAGNDSIGGDVAVPPVIILAAVVALMALDASVASRTSA